MQSSHDFTMIIPHAARNNGLLERNLPYIIKNTAPSYIYIITAGVNIPKLQYLVSNSVELIDEDAIYSGLKFSEIKKHIVKMGLPETRTGWYFQQFLKMVWAYNNKSTPWYAVWDSDTFPLQPITFFDTSGRALFTQKLLINKKDKYNKAYYDCMTMILGINKQVSYSFIAEYMIFNRDIMKELLNSITECNEKKTQPFFTLILNAAEKTDNPYTGFSEFETYGNYTIAYYPEQYTTRQSNCFRLGARFFGLTPSKYDLARMSRKYTTVSFERWDHIFFPFIWIQKTISFCMYPFRKRNKK